MKKKQYVTLLAASVLSVAVSNAVKADEVSEVQANTTNIASTEVLSEQNAKPATVETLQVEVNQLEEAVANQEAVVENLERETNLLQEETTVLSEEVSASESAYNSALETVGEPVAETLSASTEQKNALETQLKEENAKKDILAEQKASQEQLVEQLASNKEAAQSEVNNATQAVAEANKNLNELVVFKTDEEIQQLKGQADADKEQLSTAQNELKTANDLLTAKKADEQNLLTEKTELEGAITSNSSEKTAKEQQLADLTEGLAVFDAQLQEIEKAEKAANKITVSDEYVAALQQLKNNKRGTAAYEEAVATLTALNDSLRAQQVFQSNDADKAIILTDLNNLTEEVRTDLSLFVSSLINNIRTAFGTTQTTVTTGSVNMSDIVTDEYIENNWSFDDVKTYGHDTAALSEARIETGVSLDENMNTWGAGITSLTLDKLKKLAFLSIVDFMYNGNEWLHAISIAGLNPDNGVNYVGADLSTDGTTRTTIHVNGLSGATGRALPENFSEVALSNHYDLGQFGVARAKLNEQKAEALSLMDRITATIGSLSSERESLDAQTSDVVAQLNAIKELEATVANLTNKVAQLKLISEASQADYQLAIAKKDEINPIRIKLEADLAQKQAALATATNKLSVAANEYQVEFDKLQVITNAYNSSLSTIEEVNAELAVVNRRIATATSQLAALTTSQLAALKEQEQQLNANKASLASKMSKLKAKLAVLNSEKTELLSLQTSLNRKTALLVFEQKAEADRKSREEAGKQTSSNQTSLVSVSNKTTGQGSNGHSTTVPLPRALVGMTLAEKVNAATVTLANKAALETQGTLPNAGEVRSAGLAATGALAILSVIGFSYNGEKKRKKQEEQNAEDKK